MSGNRRWRNGIFVCALVAVVAGAGACGASGGERSVPRSTSITAARSGSEAETGCLYSDTSSAVYIDYQRSDDDRLTGTMQISRLQTGDAGFEVTGQSNPFIGSIDDGELTVVVGFAAPWFGTLSEDELTLNLPQDDGGLAPSHSHPPRSPTTTLPSPHCAPRQPR